MSGFVENAPVRVLLVKVIEARPLSLRMAEELGIAHASPQAILVRDGRAVWHASHFAITAAALAAACGGRA